MFLHQQVKEFLKPCCPESSGFIIFLLVYYKGFYCYFHCKSNMYFLHQTQKMQWHKLQCSRYYCCYFNGDIFPHSLAHLSILSVNALGPMDMSVNSYTEPLWSGGQPRGQESGQCDTHVLRKRHLIGKTASGEEVLLYFFLTIFFVCIPIIVSKLQLENVKTSQKKKEISPSKEQYE